MAAINLALIFGVIMVLVGPTLAEGWTTLDGPILGALGRCLDPCNALGARSRLGAQSRWIGTLGVAVVLIGIYFGLDRGVPLYRLHAATASVEAAGGKIDRHAAEGVRVDLGGTQVDDATLKQLADRLQALHVADLSLAGTKVTDDGIGVIGGLTTLKRLDLSGTQVTRAGTRSVTRMLPDVEVIQ